MKDKKSQPLIIGVIAIIAVLAGFLVMKMTAQPTKKPSEVAKKPAQTANTGSGPKQPMGTEDPACTVELEEQQIQIQAAALPGENRRDPFSPTMDISIKVDTPSAYTRPHTPIPPVTVSANGYGGSGYSGFLPGSGVQGSNTGYDDSSDYRQSANAVEEPFPRFVVTGIITGRTNVAVIRLGEERYIAKEGQTISGSYKVVSVSADGVQLSRDGRSVFLKLGGEGNAS